VYNSLQHRDTAALSHDTDRIQRAVGAFCLSLFCRSYGTQVCGGTYATNYPDRVGWLVTQLAREPDAGCL
jgi:hypothetical protein